MTLAVAALTTVELLRFEPESGRTKGMFTALVEAARSSGVDVRPTTTYRGESDLLLLWGPGAPNRFDAMKAQVAKGGHVLAWDLAYWHRDTKLRVSIDRAHPQAWVLQKPWPTSRFDADPAPVANVWDPDGPVLIAGLGEKARTQYGPDRVDAWETLMADSCRVLWPGRPVLYRGKRDSSSRPAGTVAAPSGEIDQVLKGMSLVITWHSNVAVDAIRMGVPVVCQDGAAASLCPSVVPASPTPLDEAVRRRFLANLAWFQWAPSEAPSCWAWLLRLIG